MRPPRRPSAPRSPASPRTLALRLLARRDYTTREVSERLQARGVDEAAAEALVAQLVADGLIDDRRAAAVHVRTASRVKGRGPHRIRRELEARGVDGDLARELAGTVTPEEVAETLDRIIRRKHPAGPVSAEARDRLFRHLMARGFPADAITQALKRA